MDDSKRYYWLKLPDDWYEDDTIAFLEDNGIEYSYFYLKLCSLSVKYNGNVVRIVGSTAMPYTDEMLAKKTRTSVDTVRVSLGLFERLGLIERYDDGSIFISQIEEMIGKETEGARRKRIQRAKSNLMLPDGGTMSHECPKDVPQSKKEEVESEEETYIEGDNIPSAEAVASQESEASAKTTKSKRFKKPTIEEIDAYCKEKGYDIDAEYFWNYYESIDWIRNGTKISNWKNCVNTWVRNQELRKRSKQMPTETREETHAYQG